MDRIIPILALIAVLSVVVALFVRLFRIAKQDTESKTWPSTEGTIRSAGMENVGNGRYALNLPCFAFSYVVNGEYYSGRFSLSGCDDRSAALIRELIDRKLTVLYDPHKPSTCRISEVRIEGCAVGQTND